ATATATTATATSTSRSFFMSGGGRVLVGALQAEGPGPEGQHPRRDVAQDGRLQEEAYGQGRHELLLVAQGLADDPLLDDPLDALDAAHHRLAPPLDLGEIGILDATALAQLLREHVGGLHG